MAMPRAAARTAAEGVTVAQMAAGTISSVTYQSGSLASGTYPALISSAAHAVTHRASTSPARPCPRAVDQADKASTASNASSATRSIEKGPAIIAPQASSSASTGTSSAPVTGNRKCRLASVMSSP